MNKRVALFGGSFNPIHNGHIALAEAVLAARLADEVWLMVSPQNPLKQQADLLAETTRLLLARKALAGKDQIKVSDFEFHLPRPSYTWNTLQALHEAYPDVTFSLLIGGDNWRCFHKWAHYAEILAHYSIIVYPRAESEVDEQQLPANVTLLHVPLFPFSSTNVRNKVRCGESIKSYVPKIVCDDINKAYSCNESVWVLRFGVK